MNNDKMNNDKISHDEHNTENKQMIDFEEKTTEKSSKRKGTDIWKAINIVLIALILLMGMNRFVFSKGFGMSRNNNDNLSQMGLEYYLQQQGGEASSKGIESVIRNFGCHNEIHILKDGQLEMKLVYFNGQFYEQ